MPFSLYIPEQHLQDHAITKEACRAAQGSRVQTLEIMMPGGGLYQSTQAAVFTDAPASGTFQTTRVLPVAGTWIQQRNMTGDWMIRVSLDGQVINSQMVQVNP
jgi:hypothetical protein